MFTRTNSTGSESTIVDGAAVTLEVGVSSGRNPSSLTNNFDAVKHEANSQTLVNGTGAQNIGTGGTTPVYLMGVQINAALVGTLTITGFTDTSGAASSHVLPIGFVGSWGFANAKRMETGCTMTKSSASDDGKIIVDWRPIS